MGWPTVFANLAGGNQQLSLFDAMFQQIAEMVAVPCTATGVNGLALTPIGNAPVITVYQNFCSCRFVATATTSGLVTAQFGSLPNLPVFLADGVTQASTNSIVSGQQYLLIFSQGLNGGAGGIFLQASSSAITLPLPVGSGGTSNTSFTAYAVLCGGVTASAGLQSIASVGSATQVLTSNGPGALPTFQAVGGGTAGLVSVVTYTTSQTITIPSGATKAFIRLTGGGGGTNGASGAGAGAYLEKYLSGITAGNTVVLTIGAGGTGGVNHPGGNSTLASGTQTITTLTAAGGTGQNGANAPGTGGAATNGDVNISGGDGSTVSITAPCLTISHIIGLGGDNPLASVSAGAGKGYGGGAGGDQGTLTNAAGAAGVCIIHWFT